MSGVGGIGGPGSGAAGISDIIALRRQMIERSELLQQLHAPQQTGASEGASAAGGPGGGFVNALKSALDGVSATQAKAEGITDAYQRGEVTDVAKVMLAREQSGVAFEATLQVRNRLLTAYQDIMRMGV